MERRRIAQEASRWYALQAAAPYAAESETSR
jgi:hypothetical protein